MSEAEQSAIEALMRGEIGSMAMPDEGDDDDLFDPVAGVKADPEAVAALFPAAADADEDEPPAKPRRARARTASGAARSAVAAAVSALEPEAALGPEAAGRIVIEVEPEAPEAEAPAGSPAPQAKPDLRPIPRANGESYQPRLLGAHSDVDTLRACREAGLAVMLAGYPGCGKTALVEAAFGPDLLTAAGHADFEVGDLVGTYTQRTDGTYEWVDGPLVTAMREGRPLFVDDATLISAGVLARLYPAMDGRRRIVLREHAGEEVMAAPGFYVCGAHNPGAPGAVFSEALASRFALHIEVETDLRMAGRLGVDRRAIRAASALRSQREQGVVTWAPEMRELLNFQRVLATLGEQIAASNFVSAAPEDSREEVARVLHTWFPEAGPLRLASK